MFSSSRKLVQKCSSPSTFNAISRNIAATYATAPAKKQTPSSFPTNIEYMDRVNPDGSAPEPAFVPWSKMPTAQKTHIRMREKQLKRMKRGLEAYHPVNNTLVSQRLEAYSSARRARFTMILFDAVVERGGIFSAANYQKFLKVLGVRCGCFEESQVVYRHYKESYPKDEHEIFVYNEMIQASRGNPREALKVFREIQQVKHLIPNTFTFNFLLQSLLRPYVRHTIMTVDEQREMMHERNTWGTYEFGKSAPSDVGAPGENNPFKAVEESAQPASTTETTEEGPRKTEHSVELRSALKEILALVHAHDPVILANSYIQDTISRLLEMPVFANFRPLRRVHQRSLDGEVVKPRRVGMDESAGAVVRQQLAVSYAKTYGRQNRKLTQRQVKAASKDKWLGLEVRSVMKKEFGPEEEKQMAEEVRPKIDARDTKGL